MIVYIMFILFTPFLSASHVDNEKVMEEVNRMDKRLRTIEDTIAEERIQRREDVQSVIDNLSELKNIIQGNYGINKENGNEWDAGEKTQTFMSQITHAFAKEKETNLKFRREIQDNTHGLMSEIMKRFTSVERQLKDGVSMAKKQNECTQKPNHYVTKSDLQTVINGIREITRRISTDIERKIERKIETHVNHIVKTSEELMDNFSEMQRQIASTEGTCRSTDRKLEKFRRLGVTTLTTNLNTPSDAKCLANLIDKSKTEFSSCMELKYAGFSKSGVYKLKVKDRNLRVYCDQVTDGGGWIVLQRREGGSVDLYRTWNEYKHGFGDLEGEFWVGNDNLAEITETCCHELRVDLRDVYGHTRYAVYNEFRILGEGSLYELNIGAYSGNAGDSLRIHNMMKFTTKDSDNDKLEHHNCAVGWAGAWWFSGCSDAHLNGRYRSSGFVERMGSSRITWIRWKDQRDNGGYHAIIFSEMKFR